MPILVHELKNKYEIKAIRKIRGDGNCYFRAVYYGYFEIVINKGIEAIEALLDL